MDGRAAPGPHIPVARLVGFMLHHTPLTEQESDHLARCPTCMHDMVEAARKEIEPDHSSSK